MILTDKFKTLLFLILFLSVIFKFVYAEDEKPIWSSYQDIINFFDRLANIIGTLFWTAAIIAALYSGFLFLFSGGSEEKTTKAKNMLWYTVIAIVIGLLAFGLPQLIESILKIGKERGTRV